MTSTKPSYAIALNEAHGEVHFTISGFWEFDAMQVFLRELKQSARPYLQWGVPFSVVADMDEFLPQDRQTSAAIRWHLQQARQSGLTRIAIVTRAPLVKSQFRRLAEGIDVAFFDTRLEALHWIRGFADRRGSAAV